MRCGPRLQTGVMCGPDRAPQQTGDGDGAAIRPNDEAVAHLWYRAKKTLMKEGVAVPLIFRVAVTSDAKKYLAQRQTRRLWTMPVRQAMAIAQGTAEPPAQVAKGSRGRGAQGGKRDRSCADGDVVMVCACHACIARCILSIADLTPVASLVAPSWGGQLDVAATFPSCAALLPRMRSTAVCRARACCMTVYGHGMDVDICRHMSWHVPLLSWELGCSLSNVAPCRYRKMYRKQVSPVHFWYM